MTQPLFIGHEIFRGSSYGRWHPLRVPRVSTVIDLSRALGWLPKERYITSPRAKPRALTAWHTESYVAALQRVDSADIEVRAIEQVRAEAFGSKTCGKAAGKGFAAFSTSTRHIRQLAATDNFL